MKKTLLTALIVLSGSYCYGASDRLSTPLYVNAAVYLGIYETLMAADAAEHHLLGLTDGDGEEADQWGSIYEEWKRRKSDLEASPIDVAYIGVDIARDTYKCPVEPYRAIDSLYIRTTQQAWLDFQTAKEFLDMLKRRAKVDVKSCIAPYLVRQIVEQVKGLPSKKEEDKDIIEGDDMLDLTESIVGGFLTIPLETA